jgi:hypothetical protein
MPSADMPQVYCEGSTQVPGFEPGAGVGQCVVCGELRPVADGVVDIHNRPAGPDEISDE